MTTYIARYYRHVQDGGGYQSELIEADDFLAAAITAYSKTPQPNWILYALEQQPPEEQRRTWRDRLR